MEKICIGASVRHTSSNQTGIAERVVPNGSGNNLIVFRSANGANFTGHLTEFQKIADPEEVTLRASGFDDTLIAGSHALLLARAEYVLAFISRLGVVCPRRTLEAVACETGLDAGSLVHSKSHIFTPFGASQC